MQTITVPLLLGESENRIQGLSGSSSVPFTKTYAATAHSGVTTPLRSSNINMTINPADRSISFTDIVINNFPNGTVLIAAHIHGPCADATPCNNGPIVYTICSPCPAILSNTSTIPGFTVDAAQLNGGVTNYSTAFGLYQAIMYSNKLFYLNFHTTAYPNGEIRVNLIVPGAQATITFDDAAAPTTTAIGGNAATKVIPAKLTISSLASLSGPPTAIHIHGLARRSVGAGVLVGLCQGNCPAALSSGPYEFSLNLPLQIVATRSTYINVHTAAFPTGEIRGQISPEAPLTISGSSSLSATFIANMLEEGVPRTMSFTASAPPSHSNANASFLVTFHNNNGTMTFSSTSTTGLTGLAAVHIHGPCPDRNPCDAGVVYTICGGASSCPTGANPTIPGFNVDTTQSGTDGSLLLGLMTEIQRGEKLYYVNFHTTAKPNGEIRADLVVPRASFTVTVAAPSTISRTEISTGNFLATVSASVNIAAPSGLSGAVTSAHLHLGATDGINSATLIHLCGSGGTAACLLSNSQTFTVNLPTALMSPVPLIYLNLHTAQNPGGEIRGQLVQLTAIPSLVPVTPSATPAVKSNASTVVFSLISVAASMLAVFYL